MFITVFHTEDHREGHFIIHLGGVYTIHTEGGKETLLRHGAEAGGKARHRGRRHGLEAEIDGGHKLAAATWDGIQSSVHVVSSAVIPIHLLIGTARVRPETSTPPVCASWSCPAVSLRPSNKFTGDARRRGVEVSGQATLFLRLSPSSVTGVPLLS